jgi:hypothetical protein
MSLVVRVWAPAALLLDNSFPHNHILLIAIRSIADRIPWTDFSSIMMMVCCNSEWAGGCGQSKILIAASRTSNFPDISFVIVFVLYRSPRLWSCKFLNFLSSSNDLESLFTWRLRQVNRRRRRRFVYDNLLRLWSPLTDHDRLRNRIWMVVVLGLTLISLELIRLIAALRCNALLDPDIRLPNVPI